MEGVWGIYLMGAIAFQITRGGQARSRSFTVDDANIDRIIAAYQHDADVSLTPPGQPLVTATKQQVLDYLNNFLMAQIKARVRRFEYEVAKAAIPPVVDIPTT